MQVNDIVRFVTMPKHPSVQSSGQRPLLDKTGYIHDIQEHTLGGKRITLPRVAFPHRTNENQFESWWLEFTCLELETDDTRLQELAKFMEHSSRP